MNTETVYPILTGKRALVVGVANEQSIAWGCALAFRKLGEFDRQEDFGAWVRGIARRLVANALRKESRRRQILSERLTEFLLQTQPQQLHPLAEAAEQDRLPAGDHGCVQQRPLPRRAGRVQHL